MMRTLGFTTFCAAALGFTLSLGSAPQQAEAGACSKLGFSNQCVTRKDIKKDAINSSRVANDSLKGVDIKNEAGVAFVNDLLDPAQSDLTTAWAVMESIVLTAPSAGVVTCTAVGFADTDAASTLMIVSAGWDTTGGTTAPVSHNTAIGDSGTAGNFTLPMTAMHSFAVAAGTTTFSLKAMCGSCTVGEMDYGYHSGACVFYPTVY